MVEVMAGGGKKYCIDATEVTGKQYLAWLNKVPAPMPSAQTHVACAMNTTFAPMSMPANNDKPVVNVDWCDAYAYCEMNGKRLCGSVMGGAFDFQAQPNTLDNQWYYACSNGGAQAYPYGATFMADACNDETPFSEGGMTAVVGSFSGCVGGVPDLFDMSGNVWEWEDSCEADTDLTDMCRRRGGSVYNDPDSLDCPTATDQMRGEASNNVGFRCCADLP